MKQQAEKDKYCIISFLKNTEKENKLIITENRLVVARGRVWGVVGEMDEAGHISLVMRTKKMNEVIEIVIFFC